MIFLLPYVWCYSLYYKEGKEFKRQPQVKISNIFASTPWDHFALLNFHRSQMKKSEMRGGEGMWKRCGENGDGGGNWYYTHQPLRFLGRMLYQSYLHGAEGHIFKLILWYLRLLFDKEISHIHMLDISKSYHNYFFHPVFDFLLCFRRIFCMQVQLFKKRWWNVSLHSSLFVFVSKYNGIILILWGEGGWQKERGVVHPLPCSHPPWCHLGASA